MVQANEMKEHARQAAEQQKEAGAGRIDEMADAIHSAAHELEKQFPRSADYVHDAASRLEGTAAALRKRRVEDLVKDLGDFAHTQPAAFFGGAILAGITLARVLKRSPGPQKQGGTHL